MTTTATPYTVSSNVSSNVPSAHTSQRSMRMLLLALILTALQGCTTTSGIVVDEQGKPLKGAIITARWDRQSPPTFAYMLNTCVWTTIVYTDDDGRFRTPSGQGAAARYSPTGIDVAYPGRYPGKGTDYAARRFVMVPLESEPAERRFELLDKREVSFGCKNQQSLVPYWKMLVSDMEKYAVTNSDKERNDSFWFGIDKAEFGLVEAGRRSRVRDIKRQQPERNERNERK